MDLRKLKKLIDLVEESGIAELEVTEGEEKVRITRVSSTPQAFAQPVAQMYAARLPRRRPGCGRPAAAPAADTQNAMKSPMVGTFYRSPSPAPSPSLKWARASTPATRCASSKR
ncbi:Biotin carboxyl carrier protein of acetyl-CoA carboxylase [Chromobacterium violaceum]|uniref:Biotin carboxyl carrier protein of acetyl-CoA carboxylase n=1 Tax=Chromobacterium violaceum TaxID=536 RepID=A0A447T7Y4_CHRVL|nr:Biotin carboxyl carrier protein of acetyl-CoA carboxylase [Chromobacterium violaceum]